jgi:hypothetical protein
VTDLPKRYDTAARLAYLERMVNELTRQQGAQNVIPGDVDHALNVRDYGAVGDGVTDDTVAFTEIAALGRVGYVPAGTYVISSASTDLPGGFWFGEGTLLFTGTGMGGAVQTLDRSIAAATNSGIVIQAPSISVQQLVITGRQVPLYATKGGGSYAQAVTTTLADIGLTANVTVTGTTNKFRVTIVFDIGTPAAASGITTIPSDRPIRGVLDVAGVVQTPAEIVFNSTARDVRLGSSQQWIVTGLAAGTHTFKARAALANIAGVAAGSAGWYIIRANHTTMLIEQIA